MININIIVFMHCCLHSQNNVKQHSKKCKLLCLCAGHKRVANYIKRQDKQSRLRAHMSREELEVEDINREAEEQLVHQHCTPERLVAER